MRSLAKRFIAALALALALVPLLAGTAWASDYDITISTQTGDASQGQVGFQNISGFEWIGPDAVLTHAFGPYELGGVGWVYAVPASGYRFAGWINLATGEVVSEETPFAVDLKAFSEDGSRPIRLEARFEEMGADMATVALSCGKDFGTKYVYVKRGSVFILPDCPFDTSSLTSRVFNGWDLGFPGATITVDQDVTVTANWAWLYERTFSPVKLRFCDGRFVKWRHDEGYDPNSQAVETMEVEAESLVTLPECMFSRDGFVFDRWDCGKPGEQIVAEFSRDITALWKLAEPADGPVLTLRSNAFCESIFRVDGAIIPDLSPRIVEEGTTITIELVGADDFRLKELRVEGLEVDIPEPGDLKVWEWKLQFEMPANDVTIEVAWEFKPISAHYYPNGGAGDEIIIPYQGPSYRLPDCDFTPPEGMEFMGWLCDLDLSDDGAPFRGVLLQPGEVLDSRWAPKIMPLWRLSSPVGHTHSIVKVEAVEPTCDTSGHDTCWKCTWCGKLFADADGTHEIAAPVEIPAGHDWGEWTVTKEPTATEEGEKTRICKRDPSHTETEAIPVVKTPGEYSPAYGAGATWSADDGEGLTFIIKRGLDDDTTYSHFLGASVDGASVPPLGYEASPGSLELTLKPAFLASLAPGAHTLTVTFDDGAVDVAFTTAEASGGGGPEPALAPVKDGLPAWAWILIGLGGLAVLGGVAYAVLILRARRQAATMRHGVSPHSAASSHAASGTHRATREDATLADRYRRH